MPDASIAQYGIGFFAVAGLIYLVGQMMNLWFRKRETADLIRTVTIVSEVVENNTLALKQLENMIELNLTRQEAKIDELVAYVRRRDR